MAHELSHIKNYDILVSTLAVTLVGAIALVTDMAIRMMWWNGGRSRRSGDQDNGGNPLALVGFALLILAPFVARAMQADDLPQARDAGRHQCLPAHALPAGFDLGAGEAAGRHDGHPLGHQRHGAHVDRATDVGCRRSRASRVGASSVRHPPAARRADRPAERALRGPPCDSPPFVRASLVALAATGLLIGTASVAGAAPPDDSTAPPTTTAAAPTTAATPTTAARTDHGRADHGRADHDARRPRRSRRPRRWRRP